MKPVRAVKGEGCGPFPAKPTGNGLCVTRIRKRAAPSGPEEVPMGCEYLSDDELVAHFQNCTLAKADFHHADHVRLAFLYVRLYGVNAETRFLEGIRNLAVSFGVSEKFHYTITVAWMRLVAAHAGDANLAKARPYAEWIRRNPGLLRKDLLAGHFSGERLSRDSARVGWVEPDLAPLPPGGGS